jgi:hypothetical protein
VYPTQNPQCRQGFSSESQLDESDDVFDKTKVEKILPLINSPDPLLASLRICGKNLFYRYRDVGLHPLNSTDSKFWTL